MANPVIRIFKLNTKQVWSEIEFSKQEAFNFLDNGKDSKLRDLLKVVYRDIESVESTRFSIPGEITTTGSDRICTAKPAASLEAILDTAAERAIYLAIAEQPMNEESAKELAFFAHRRQTDAFGDPYSEHLERVAARCSSQEEKIVAFLHDLFEDTNCDPYLLAPELQRDVWCLTRDIAETYSEYIQGIRKLGSDVAVKVKIADLQDHLEHKPERLPQSLIQRYQKALAHLQQ